jgi:multidrug efflux pump subunit AcrB
MLSRFFAHRPIFAWVIAIVVMSAGAFAISTMGIEQYPDIAPPPSRSAPPTTAPMPLRSKTA